MSSNDAKQRAGRAFEKVAQRQHESELRVDEQRKSEVALATKIKRLREQRMERDAAAALEAANAPVPEKPAAAARKKKAAVKKAAD